MNDDINKKKFLLVSGGVILLFGLFYIMPTVWFDFLSYTEIQRFSDQATTYQANQNALQQISDIKNELINVRITIFRADCIRSLMFILITAALLYFVIIKKVKANVFYILLGIIVVADIWTVDKRYFNNEKVNTKYTYWEDSYKHDNPFQAAVADKEIMKKEISESPAVKQAIEKEVNNSQNFKGFKSEELQNEKEKIAFRELNFSTNYRVFTLQNPFANSEISYYHKSIGGYHGAKLKRYQELWDFYGKKEYENFYSVLQNKPTFERVNQFLADSFSVLSMLNTKYIIYNPGAPPIENINHFGNAWFVKQIKFAKNADEEITWMKQVDKNNAIVNEASKSKINTIQFDTTASIKMTNYKTNSISYETSSSTDQFAVFSEIYYNKGWNAYLDGKQTDIFQANYVLRAMNIPKGSHKIEFKFEPKSYFVGRKISYAGSGIIVIFVAGLLFLNFWRKKIHDNLY